MSTSEAKLESIRERIALLSRWLEEQELNKSSGDAPDELLAFAQNETEDSDIPSEANAEDENVPSWNDIVATGQVAPEAEQTAPVATENATENSTDDTPVPAGNAEEETDAPVADESETNIEPELVAQELTETLKMMSTDELANFEVITVENDAITQGSSTDICYLISEGAVKFFDDMREPILLGKGHIIGASEIISHIPLTFDYRTTGDVKAYSLPGALIREQIGQSSPPIRGMIKYTHDRILSVDERSTHALIDDNFLADLGKKVIPVSMKEGDILFKAGDESDAFYYIDTGKVAIRAHTGEELAQLGSGKSFGEIAALTAQPRTATVEALTETNLRMISRKEIEKIIAKEPPLVQLLMRGILGMMAVMSTRGRN